MRKFKLDKNTSLKISSLVLAGTLFITSLTGCSNKQEATTEKDPVAVVTTLKDNTEKGITSLFPTMNNEIVENSSIIILLDDIAKENENGKISADVISNFKAKIDSDNMMDDFNSFLNVLEQTMIQNKSLMVTSNLVSSKDKDILSKIEKITGNIINGSREEVKSNFKLIYTLIVKEDEITFDGLTFDIRDLGYAERAIAGAYARTAAYFAKTYITETEYSRIDARTNDQNNKAYIKTDLEILGNQMEEKSLVDVATLFNNEYASTKGELNGKVNLSDESIKNLVNYINLEYLNSDNVANKDKNTILGEYTDEKVSDVLTSIAAICEYNLKNPKNIVLVSNMLVDEYKKETTGKVDIVMLDYVLFNSYKFLSETNEKTTAEELFNNAYFQNLYQYFRKANFVHDYSADKSVSINYQDVSDGAKFVANQMVYVTLMKRPNIFKYQGYEEKINLNLKESIQYIQNTIMGECAKIDTEKFKIK